MIVLLRIFRQVKAYYSSNPPTLKQYRRYFTFFIVFTTSAAIAAKLRERQQIIRDSGPNPELDRLLRVQLNELKLNNNKELD